MEIKKTLLIFVLCAGSIQLQAQESPEQKPLPFDRTGTLRAQANLAGGYLFQQKDYAAYITGDFDLYVSQRVSITGEGWYSFALTSNQEGLQKNHALYTGFSYHLLRHKHWDPYVGFSPGAGFVSVSYAGDGRRTETNIMVTPLASFTAGCNWYVGSIFHFFLKLRFTSGQVMGDMPEPVRLEELKITGGLGWNIRCWNRKKK